LKEGGAGAVEGRLRGICGCHERKLAAIVRGAANRGRGEGDGEGKRRSLELEIGGAGAVEGRLRRRGQGGVMSLNGPLSCERHPIGRNGKETGKGNRRVVSLE
jgi:hypothetical protein